MNNSAMPGMMSITVRYGEHLQKITGKEEEQMFIGEAMEFAWLLHFLFTDYPEIQKQYPPGMLGFTVNGKAPKIQTRLFNGDELWFEAVV